MFCCDQKLLCGRFAQYLIYRGYCSYVQNTDTDLPLSRYFFEHFTHVIVQLTDCCTFYTRTLMRLSVHVCV
jgi:hypothetical protein